MNRQAKPRELIRERRKVCGLTQREVAQAIGINRISYMRIESGMRKLYPDEIIRLGKLLNLDETLLLREAQNA